MLPSNALPEHVVIRDYVQALRHEKLITRESLTEAFVEAYLDQVPLTEGVPQFEQVHRLDSVADAERKADANEKKLWRAIMGQTYFPLAFRAPLLTALELLGDALGVGLAKRLHHNAGLLYVPLALPGEATSDYARWLREFSEANSQIVVDVNDDGVINSEKTRQEIMDVIEQSLQMLRAMDLGGVD